MVSEGSVHHSREGVAEKSPHHGSQEAERMLVLTGFSFSLFHSIWPSRLWGIVSRLANPLWKCPHRHTKKCALLISQALLNPIKLTIKIDH
jgi:hypothetical protein